MPDLKALLINIEATSQPGGRLPRALTRAGFTARAICADNALSNATRYVERSYVFKSSGKFGDLATLLRQVVDEWEPTILVPSDDFAVWFLHDLWQAHRLNPAI